MLNSKNEANAGYDAITQAYYREYLETPDPNPILQTYFSILYGLAAALEPEVIVEIGTQHGTSSRAFLAATPTVDRVRKGDAWVSLPNEPKRVVHSIDINPEFGRETLALVTAMGCTDRWKFHLGRSQDIEPIPCDLLYVDGDHSYDAVCSDMARHGAHVRDGGLVLLDDYHWSWPGKVRWVDERWDALEPIIVGATAAVYVTPRKREIFRKDFR